MTALKPGDWLDIGNGQRAMIHSIAKGGKSYVIKIPDGTSPTGATFKAFTFGEQPKTTEPVKLSLEAAWQDIAEMLYPSLKADPVFVPSKPVTWFKPKA